MSHAKHHSHRIMATATLLCATAFALTAPAAQPAAKADPQLARGEHLARLVCSACHVVASDQEWPPLLQQPAPAFAEIAQRPGVSAVALQKFITSTHWDEKSLPMRMPDLQIPKDEAQAVVRYILSLRKP